MSKPAETRAIYCCGCGHDVWAVLTDGRRMYPHRKDLHALPFWECMYCGNFVGCHYKTADRTKPLGVIPTPLLRKARSQIHAVIDPLWQSKRIGRRRLYARLGDALGREYHTAELRSLDEARTVLQAAQKIAEEMKP